MDAIQAVNLFYVVTMFVSAFAFLYLSAIWKKVPSYFFYIHIGVVSWSGFMYLNLVFGEPFFEIGRYLDWLVSTPLLLLALGLSAMYLGKLRILPLILAVASQILIIVSGLFAELSLTDAARYGWFAIGSILLIDILYYIWFSFSKSSQNRNIPSLHKKYIILAGFFTIQWFLYPIVWILGTSGIGTFDALATNILFVVLPIISKAGFGFLDLYLLHQFHVENGDINDEESISKSGEYEEVVVVETYETVG